MSTQTGAQSRLSPWPVGPLPRYAFSSRTPRPAESATFLRENSGEAPIVAISCPSYAARVVGLLRLAGGSARKAILEVPEAPREARDAARGATVTH